MSGQAQRQRPARFGFAFLDETGTLGGARDPFFAVGLLKCSEPHKLARPMQRIRDRQHFYDEIKWNKVSAKKLPLMVDLVNVFFSSEATFSAFVADKTRHDVIGRFGGPFKAYEALARQLVRASVGRGETLWVIADEYSTPPGETFEENVRDYVNRTLRRTAVAGVSRMRSSGVDLLQLPKVKLLRHVKKRAGARTFVGGFRDGRLNIAEYRPRTA